MATMRALAESGANARDADRPLLAVTELRKQYQARAGMLAAFSGRTRAVRAVDGVSFALAEHETLGLVGESGCGKTTIGRIIVGVTPASSGRVVFDGHEITALPRGALRPLRKHMQMIFQDLDAALNPRMRVRDILREAITLHHRVDDPEVARRTSELLDQVNLKSAKLASFPHELSGGEKRRVGIARVLAVGARFIVADEPTSALDVSIQAQIVNLLRDLQTRLGLSYLFISHDLEVVELMSHRIAVMYLGRIVEIGPAERVARASRHPYTSILWSSLVEKRSDEVARNGGAAWGVFDFERPGQGCRFAPRCPVYEAAGRPAICTDPASEPALHDAGGGHHVACHFPIAR
jgi:oligopeptide/dipeptide ABC transporter ATP-binding protein